MTIYRNSFRFITVTEGERPTHGCPTGSILFDETDIAFYQWDGDSWNEIGLGGSASVLDDLTDVDTTTDTPDTNDVLTWDGTNWVPEAPPGASGGEANTITNINTAGEGLYKEKIGVDFKLYGLDNASTKISLALNATNNTIDFDVIDSELSIDWDQLTSIPTTFTPAGHHTSHESGGGDEISVGDDQLSANVSLLDAANIFTAVQTINLNTGYLLRLFKDTGTNNQDGGLSFDFKNNATPTPEQIQYAAIVGGIVSNTDNAESGRIRFQVRNSGSLGTKMEIDNAGILKIGANLRLQFSESGQTTAHTITFPDADTLCVGDTDSRLTDDRDPTAHASSHSDGGADEIDITNLAGYSGNSSEVLKGDGTWGAGGGGGASALDDLTDVTITTVTTDNIIKYNGSAWVNTFVDYSELTGVPSEFTPSAHNHSGADITSGTVGATRGGTGKATFTQHALLKGGASNAYDEIAVGSNDDVLAVVSGTPAWKTPNSETVGKATADGDGSTTSFEITHGVSGVDSGSYCFVDCSSHAIARTWTIDATKIYIEFTGAPDSGTGNVIVYWRIIP